MKILKRVLLFFSFFLIVGYAAVNTVTNLNGDILIGENYFNVIFSSVTVDGKNITNSSVKENGRLINVNTSELLNLGDISQIKFKITNESEQYDAKIKVNCNANDDKSNYYSYELNGPTLIGAKEEAMGDITIKLNKEFYDNLIKIKQGTGKTKGDELCIGDECFYVMSVSNSNIQMISKYNLYVGNTCTPLGECNEIDKNDKLYGKQHETALGSKKGLSSYIGVTPFSTGSNEYEGSLIQEYVNNYATYLNKTYSADTTGTIAALSDLEKITGLYTTSFWTSRKEGLNNNANLAINTDTNHYVTDSTLNNTYGVRPIIITPVSELERLIKKSITGTFSCNFSIDAIERVEVGKDERAVTKIKQFADKNANGLIYDETDDKNIRYIGTNPDNYVYYNDELWRIIGVMNNVSDSEGDITPKLKIIRASSIGSYTWSNVGTGKNNWYNSSIQTVLNTGPYWNRTSGICPSGYNGATEACNFTTTGLTEKAKTLISKVVWNIGESVLTNTLEFYENEKKLSPYSTDNYNWKGYVGLPSPSDYGFALNHENREECLTISLGNTDYSKNLCHEQNWLQSPSGQIRSYTINSMVASSSSVHAIKPNAVITRASWNKEAIFPTLYLNSDVKITNGTGTDKDPYILSL